MMSLAAVAAAGKRCVAAVRSGSLAGSARGLRSGTLTRLALDDHFARAFTSDEARSWWAAHVRVAGVEGFEAASMLIFEGRALETLSIGESAILVAQADSSARYDRARLDQRRRFLLRRLVEEGLLTAAAAAEASSIDLPPGFE